MTSDGARSLLVGYGRWVAFTTDMAVNERERALRLADLPSGVWRPGVARTRYESMLGRLLRQYVAPHASGKLMRWKGSW